MRTEYITSGQAVGRRKLLESRAPFLVFSLGLCLSSCSFFAGQGTSGSADSGKQALVLAQAVLGEDADGKAKTLPARVLILERNEDAWSSRVLEDPTSTAFHKAMAYQPVDGPGGLLTLGGDRAAVKFWADGGQQTLWEADFGGKFSRMRDAEVGDIYGDGSSSIAVVTHDQGVVAILRALPGGGFEEVELDRQDGVIIHEVELGDLDGDGVLEIYATPSAPNRLDGTPQDGEVVRYIPARGKGREEIVNLGDRHAKEILAADLDGNGRDELYISVEAVAGGRVEILRYVESDGQSKVETIASLNDRLCRFLTAGDVDGDGRLELVAATNRSGLWHLRPDADQWRVSGIDQNSSGFEHASILLDLDRDGRDELYVASDRQSEVRRYDWTANGWKKKVLFEYEGELTGFTWNIMPVPVEFLP